mmetsp:Transcript_112520/g.363388  ORF Transcript_112520/g.363388 Transcript_112520/m.363388 type:complete len:519 (+) Transcript_112520:116-1672(+)
MGEDAGQGEDRGTGPKSGFRRSRNDKATTAELEAIVFGTSEVEPATGGAKAKRRRHAHAAVRVSLDPWEETGEQDDEGAKEPKDPAVAAWVDPDDVGLEVDVATRSYYLRRSDDETKVTGSEYERRLREQFVKLHGSASWPVQDPAQAADAFSSDESEAEAPLPASSAGHQRAAPGGVLRPTDIDVKRLREVEMAPGNTKGPAVIQALQFHPDSGLLLTAGLDKRLRLFAVDGDENPKVSSYFFNHFPIKEASFLPDGKQIVVTGESHKMWGLDVQTGEAFGVSLLCAQFHKRYFGLTVGPNPADAPGSRSSQMYAVLGDNGTVLACDAAMHQPVRTMRMRAPGVAAVFAPDSDSLFTADTDNNLYEWDLSTGRCRQRAQDTFAVKITCLAVRRTATRAPRPLLAVGTSSGNIDIFDTSGPKLPTEPTHSVGNLTTSVRGLCFHHEGELLAAFSREKKDQLKLVHAETATVFQNWPTSVTPLNRVSAVDLSRNGGLLAIGNERGRVLLYQLRHYEVGK